LTDQASSTAMAPRSTGPDGTRPEGIRPAGTRRFVSPASTVPAGPMPVGQAQHIDARDRPPGQGAQAAHGTSGVATMDPQALHGDTRSTLDDQAPNGQLRHGSTLAPVEVRARMEIAGARAAAKLADLADNPRAPALLNAARGARNARQRVVWLQRWGSAWAEPLAQVAACRRGCSHCCSLPVAITSTEARLIGEAVGREPAQPPAALRVKDAATDAGFAERHRAAEQRLVGVPCPFLEEGECSIYEHRPFGCRTHLSLDDDDLLCRRIEGVEVTVPYADARMVYALFLGAQSTEALADIREFFPAFTTGPGQEGVDR
jgi:Fe-S-cluster containining protein